MLFLARTVYAFNWYNVGAILPLLGTGLGATTAELGVVLGAFLVGAAVFQIPAGLLALRWGNRPTSVFALGLMGAFSLASAFSPNWVVLAALRFGAGAGAAFFFAPALGLVASYFPHGSRGPIIGLYNSGFSLGAAVGIFAGAFIGVVFGWPWALAVGGIGLLLTGLIAFFTLPRSDLAPPRRSVRELWAAGLPVFRSTPLWALALGTAGLWGGFYTAAQYFIQYAHVAHPGWPVALAAGIPTVLILAQIPGGPLGGWFGERGGAMRRVLLYGGLLAGAVVLSIPFLPVVALLPVFVLFGFAEGVFFAVLYLIPSYLPEGREASLALALAFLNSIQIFLGSAVAITFGFLADRLGYTDAWLFAGAATLAPLPLLALVRGMRPLSPTPAVGTEPLRTEGPRSSDRPA